MANSPGLLRPDVVLYLQRTAGNRAVQRLITAGRATAAVQKETATEEAPKTEEENQEKLEGIGLGEAFEDAEDEEEGAKGEASAEVGEQTFGISSEDGASLETGEDGPTVGIGKEGLYAKDVKPFGEDGPALSLSADKQEAEFEVPGTKWSFPPPDGEWKLDLLDLKIPITPPGGIGVSISAGITGGLKLSGITVKTAHQVKERGGGQYLVRRLSFDGNTSLTGSIGAHVSVGVWGGIPYVATLEAGLKTTGQGKLELKGQLDGALDIVEELPVASLGEKKAPVEVERKGRVRFLVSGLGDLTAQLQAYLAGQILIFKGEFFTFDIAKATIAGLKGGAVRTTVWKGKDEKGESSWDKLPGNENWVDVNWLFKDIIRARKLDAAKAKMLVAKEDVEASEDVQGFFAAHEGTQQEEGEISAPMRQRLHGEVQALLEQREQATQRALKDAGTIKERTAAIQALVTEIEQIERSQRAWDERKKRGEKKPPEFSRSEGTIFKSSPMELHVAQLRQQKAPLEAELKKLIQSRNAAEKDYASLVQKIGTAQAAWAAKMSPEKIGSITKEAKSRLQSQTAENKLLFDEQIAKLENQAQPKSAALQKKLEEVRRAKERATASIDEAARIAEQYEEKLDRLAKPSQVLGEELAADLEKEKETWDAALAEYQERADKHAAEEVFVLLQIEELAKKLEDDKRDLHQKLIAPERQNRGKPVKNEPTTAETA